MLFHFVSFCLSISSQAFAGEKNELSEADGQVAYTIYLVRHAEKEFSHDDPALTDKGKARAILLADLLGDKHMDKIFSTNYQRTLQTAAPLAESLKLKIDLYNPKELKAFSKQLLSSQQNALVVGHSNTTAALAEYLSGESVREINDNEFNRLIKIRFNGSQIKLVELNLDHI